ncbi:GDP-mannose 4,6-dehydratase [Rathayibacter sp. YIM 133350]|uniref:GDP-mannose 4,6-dehydratase n=1 Tax=Rathayibacter sp. YIM 133350 TaxID=3131992 RepID=UPI00307D797E
MAVALVTGISGQDGSILSESLRADGYEVHGLVRSADAGSLEELKQRGAILHEVDLTDLDEVNGVVIDVAPDEVYSLASISSVFQSWQAPVDTARVNGLTVVQLLSSIRALQRATGSSPHFVHASSAEIFGNPSASPQSESTPIAPVSPYGAAKAFAHQMVQVFRAEGVRASNCILYNHESTRRPPSFVTRKITQAAAAIAYGEQETLTLGTLETRRDWGWAPDYVDALRRTARGQTGDDFVIATGETHSIADFVEAAFARVGISDWRSRVSVDSSLSRPADPLELRGDATKARTSLDWKPTKTFKDIVAAMVDADLAGLEQRKR